MSSMDIEALSHYTDTYTSCGHLYLARLMGKNSDYRNSFITKMAERGISCNVHFKPLPLHTAYKNLGFNIADFPNAYSQFENEVSLPLNSKMTVDDVYYVLENIKGIYE